VNTGDALPRGDRGKGSLNDYRYDMTAKNGRVRMVLEDSDPYQEELRTIVENSGPRAETAVSLRTREQEAVDEPIEIRLFTGRRVSGPVGRIPRGLESVFEENLRLLDDRTGVSRMPVDIVRKGGSYRVAILLGEVRDRLR
jgi:hypothetical protein